MAGASKNVSIPIGMQNVGNVLAQGAVSIKDMIAPSFIEVDFNHLKIDDKFYRTLYVTAYPRYVIILSISQCSSILLNQKQYWMN